MTDRIQFHLDENVNSAIASALQRVGVDVSTTVSAGLIGQSDLEQFVFIQQENRVMVTHDDDFLKIVSVRNDHPGIAYCQKDKRSTARFYSHAINPPPMPDF